MSAGGKVLRTPEDASARCEGTQVSENGHLTNRSVCESNDLELELEMPL